MSRPLRRLALLLLPLCLLLLAAAPLRAAERPLCGTVTWVYDGDTLEVAGVGRVRLIGIDTPEKEAGDRDRSFRRLGADTRSLRRISGEALRFNIAAAKGKTVVLEPDREPRDRYGRLLAYVRLPDGRLLNRLLLEQGYAVVYRRFDFRLKEEFLAAEAEAKRRGVGVWAK